MEKKETMAQRIARKLPKKQRLIRVALGQEKADLVMKNAAYINVFSNEVCEGDIAVAEGLVVGMGRYRGIQEYEAGGKIIAPGFIDAHIHLESSLLSPYEFAKAVIPHGTTTVICDPHEIANVCGKKGIEYMLEACKLLPIDVHFMLPSCVPAVPFDESGAQLEWEDIDEYFTHPRVLGLAEMMNYPGVLAGDPGAVGKIIAAQAHHKKIDGHAPQLSGNELNAYMSAGVYSDHECFTLDNALEKLRKGQFIMIREGTAAQNLETLMPLITPQYASRCMFSTDDKHPADLLHKGHIDYIARKAVSLGADPLTTIKVASHYAARYFLMNNKGAISPGYLADFVVLDGLDSLNVQTVFKRGRLIYDGQSVLTAPPQMDSSVLNSVRNTCRLPDIAPDRLAHKGALPLIGMVDGQIITQNLGQTDRIAPEQDILKIAVCERHKNTGHIGIAFLKGYGLKRGAVATSIAHDSHNIIAVGENEADMAAAINHIKQMQGGMAVVRDSRVLADLPLPIAGLMSDQEIGAVNEGLERVKAAAHAFGVGSGVDPFMTLSFMSLPVIPALRLTSKGVFDVEKWQFVS